MGDGYLCSNEFLLSRNGGLRAHPTRNDEDGEILERYEYDAYGKPTMWLGDYDTINAEISPYGNPYYFTGRRVDEINWGEWLIQYNRNRFYDYYTGRWLNQDPIGYQDGVNLYAYVNSNPVNKVDPQGLFSECAIGGGADCAEGVDPDLLGQAEGGREGEHG